MIASLEADAAQLSMRLLRLREEVEQRPLHLRPSSSSYREEMTRLLAALEEQATVVQKHLMDAKRAGFG